MPKAPCVKCEAEHASGTAVYSVIYDATHMCNKCDKAICMRHIGGASKYISLNAICQECVDKRVSDAATRKAAKKEARQNEKDKLPDIIRNSGLYMWTNTESPPTNCSRIVDGLTMLMLGILCVLGLSTAVWLAINQDKRHAEL